MYFCCCPVTLPYSLSVIKHSIRNFFLTRWHVAGAMIELLATICVTTYVVGPPGGLRILSVLKEVLEFNVTGVVPALMHHRALAAGPLAELPVQQSNPATIHFTIRLWQPIPAPAEEVLTTASALSNLGEHIALAAINAALPTSATS